MAETPPDDSSEAQPTAQERVRTSMTNIAHMIDEAFVTDLHRVSFMTVIELHIDPHGQLVFGDARDSEDYRTSHILQYTAIHSGEGGPAEESLKMHMPKVMVGHNYEYTYDLGTDPPHVQRGGSDNAPAVPQREGDAVYAEWVESALRARLEAAQHELLAGPDDPDLPVVTYPPPQGTAHEQA